jgi:hypothetical protein
METMSTIEDTFTISSPFYFCSTCGKVFDEGIKAFAPAASI